MKMKKKKIEEEEEEEKNRKMRLERIVIKGSSRSRGKRIRRSVRSRAVGARRDTTLCYICSYLSFYT